MGRRGFVATVGVAWLLGGCGGATTTTDTTTTTATTAATTATARTATAATATTAATPATATATTTGVSGASASPEEIVRAALPGALEMLAKGQDEAFIDAFAIPEELPTILDGASKAKLVDSFRREKHDRVVKMLKAIADAPATSIEADPRGTLVSYEVPSMHKRITFLVKGSRVFIQN